jgi:hypothetical protein
MNAVGEDWYGCLGVSRWVGVLKIDRSNRWPSWDSRSKRDSGVIGWLSSVVCKFPVAASAT